jgi:hypothetical protein
MKNLFVLDLGNIFKNENLSILGLGLIYKLSIPSSTILSFMRPLSFGFNVDCRKWARIFEDFDWAL